MRHIGTETRKGRQRGLIAALLLLALLLLLLLTPACEEEVKVLPASSPASDVAEPIASAQASPTTEVAASPVAELDEEARQILERAEDSMSALDTYHASVSMRMLLSGVETEASLEVDIEQPERSYGVVSAPGVPGFEMVVEGLKAHVRLDDQGWQTAEEAFGLSLEQLGVKAPDPGAQLAILRLVGTTDMLGGGEVGGVPVYHLRTWMSAEEFARVSAELFGGGAGGLIGEATDSVQGGAVVLDYYIGRDDFLVRRGEADFTATAEGSGLRMNAVIVYSAFNEPVDIPEIE